jgi:spore coat protein U-like protein
MKKLILTAFTLALVAVAPAAMAQSATSDLAVSASVAANCTITTAPVAFGAYDPVVANATNPLNNNGSVTIACTKGSAPNVALGLGSHVSGTTRRMLGGTSGEFLTYELFQPPNTTPGTACTYPGTTVWGTSGANLFTPTAAGSKAARTYNVCGTVAGNQDVSVDASYTDTVVATVNF